MNSIQQFLQRTPFIIFLSIIFILVEGCLTGVYGKYFGTFHTTEVFALCFFVIYSLITYFVIPIAASKLFLKENLVQLGLTFPKRKILAVILVIIGLALLIPYIVHFARLAAFQSYSLGQPSLPKFIFITGVLFPLYYVAEEFFFRGFLFISLWNRIGWHSFWVTDVIFTAAHIGKPWLEVLLCIPVSIMLNILTLSTRSIVPAIIVHSTMGILLSTLVTFQLV